MIYIYTAELLGRFGPNSSVDLGPIAPNEAGSYPDTPELQRDIQAALAAGIKNYNIFAFDGISKMNNMSTFKDVPAPKKPKMDVRVRAMRSAIELSSPLLPRPK